VPDDTSPRGLTAPHQPADWSPPSPDWHLPPPMVVEPVRLDGRIVRLEPMEDRHRPGLMAAGLADPTIWRWTVEWIETPEAMATYLDAMTRFRDEGSQRAFVTIDQSTDEVIGSSRFFAFDYRNWNLEIGYTWLVPSRQRGGANLEAKLLQLTHAFETLGCRRVQFKTDSLNDKSRNALLGIGATFEGILRNQQISQGGRMRHSAYYSVIDGEWPGVKTHIQERLARHLQAAKAPRPQVPDS
jgi:RimJ/RimL family protein N-acetyltransferase